MIDRPGILSFGDPDLRSRWRVLVNHSPQSSPFLLPEFAEAIQDVLGLRYIALGLLGSRHETPSAQKPYVPLQGGLLAFEKDGLSGKRIVVPPFTPYTSAFFAPVVEHPSNPSTWNPHLDSLLSWLEGNYASADLHFHPAVQDVRPASWRSWAARPLYTYISDFRPGMDVTSAWSTSARRTFQKSSGEYQFSECLHDIEGVVGLVERSYGRHGRRLPLPAPKLEALVQHLTESGMVRVFTVRPLSGSKLEGGLILLTYNKTAYYWIAGSQPGGAMTVLLGHLWKQLVDEGFTRFDFIGANTPSIAEFKRRFGPTLVPYYRLEWRKRPMQRLFTSLRTRLRV